MRNLQASLRHLSILTISIPAALLLGCGGGGHPSQPASTVAVSIAPAGPITINTSGQIGLLASVTGSANGSVQWNVDGVAGGNLALGTIVANGPWFMYTAPASAGTHSLTATSAADNRAVASIPITVGPTCAPPASSSLILNVKNPPYNAQGDGVTDDTSAFKAAIAAVAGTGGTLTVPAGTYLINPVASGHAGLVLGSQMTLALDPQATLQAMPTSSSDYVVVLVSGVGNVNVVGGTIIGNRYNNTITDTNEAGFGLMITASQQVVVDGVTAKDCWCDGFYVGGGSSNITLNAAVADGNRRNAMSITSVNAMVVRGSTFSHSAGLIESGVFVCGTGLDLEPNAGDTIANVQLLECAFTANPGSGLEFGPALANLGSAFVNNILVDGCSSTGNGFHQEGCGIGTQATSGNQISHNTITGTTGIGIYLRSGSDDTLVIGNTVTAGLSAPAPAEGWVGIGIELVAPGPVIRPASASPGPRN